MKDIRTQPIIFDELTEEEFEKMSEQIIEQNDIDYRSIQSNAFAQLGLKQKKHFSRKKLTIVVLAAAIGLSAIGIGAAATVSFQKAFGGFVEGDSPDGVSAGSRLTVSSDSTDVHFMGICGNAVTTCASFTLKNKDGSDFTQDYTKVTLDYDGNLFETMPDYYPVDYANPDFHTDEPEFRSVWLTDNNVVGSQNIDEWFYGQVTYQMEDNGTVRAFVLGRSAVGGSIKGKTLHIRDRKINAYSTLETIYQSARSNKDGKVICSDVITALGKEHPDLWKAFVQWEENTYTDNGMTDEEMEQANDFIRLIRKAYAPLLKDNQVVMMDGIRNGWLICEKTPIEMNYEIAVGLDYTTTTRTFDIDTTTEMVYTPHPEITIENYTDYDPSDFEHDPVTFTLESLEADAMMITFKARSEARNESQSMFERSLYDNVTVEMKDGTKYNTWSIGNMESSMDNEPEVSVHRYWLLTDDENTQLASIDPNDIAAVYLGDIRLY